MFNMDETAVKRLHMVITGIVGGIIGLSIAQGNYLIPLIAIIIGLATVHVIRSKAKEKGVVLEDERIELIASKASDRTFRTVTIVLAVVGFVIKALSNPVGDVLLYVGCSMLLVYLAFYHYYAWKFGGV